MSASAKEETDSKSDSNQANNGLSINNHKQNSEQSNIAAKGSEQPEQSTTPNGPKSIGKPVLAVAAVLVLLAFLFVFNRKPVQDPNIVDINGRIEAPETYITAGVGTHVQSVNVQEGDIVHRGQVLLALDSKALRVKMQATGSEEQLAMQAQGQSQIKRIFCQDIWQQKEKGRRKSAIDQRNESSRDAAISGQGGGD
jgi:multidrug efflux pump subunit AcrA (membrane-fusion protein)